jgi:MFS family permease
MTSDRAWLAALCAAELGTMLVFSSFSALLPLLTREWNLSNTEAGLILAFYQVGYIAAVAILATLTDYMPPRHIYYGLLCTAESAIISTGIADAAEPAYLGRTMALQSSVGFAAGALGPAAFGAMLDWAPRLGSSADGKWIWAFALLGLAALAGPLAVGFRDARAGTPVAQGRRTDPETHRV